MLVIASHQIEVFPYLGFWNRMANSDIMDLGGLYDYFSWGKNAYYHRVKVGLDNDCHWFTLPIRKPNSKPKHNEVELKYENNLMSKLWDNLNGTYRGFKYWKCVSEDIESLIKDRKYKYMWEFNFAALELVRNWLKIKTPLSISAPPDDDNLPPTDKIISQLKSYGDNIEYLCGPGGKNYLELDKMSNAGVKVTWQDWNNPVADCQTVSILSCIAKYGVEFTSKVVKESK